MRNALAAFALAAGLSLTAIQPAATQATITIGGNDRQLVQLLESRGYTDVVITERGLTITRLEACRGGDKFLIKINVLGRITSNSKIGTCQARFAGADAERAMSQAGYTDITTRVEGRNVVANGCREGRQFQLTFNLRGDLIDRRRGGRCRAEALSPREIRNALQEQGYNRIRFTDRELPRYVAEACKDTTRVELTMNRAGNIRQERRIGRCRGEIDPRNIATVLQNQGYSRVETVQLRRAPYMVRACKDDERQEIIVSRFGEALSNTKIGNCRRAVEQNQLGAFVESLGYERVNVLRGNRLPYLVEACKGATLVELTLDRFGEIRREQNVGNCAQPLNEAQAREKLSADGYYVTKLDQRRNGSWDVEACKGLTQVSLRLTRFGETARERQIGECRSQSVYDVLSTLESRGAEQVQIYVEGCFRNQTYRWSFDRLGNRTGRERIGRSC